MQARVTGAGCKTFIYNSFVLQDAISYRDNDNNKYFFIGVWFNLNIIINVKASNRLYFGLAVLRSCGLAVLRSCGLAVLRSCGLAVLRSCSLAVLRSCGLAVLRSCGLCGHSSLTLRSCLWSRGLAVYSYLHTLHLSLSLIPSYLHTFTPSCLNPLHRSPFDLLQPYVPYCSSSPPRSYSERL